MKKTTAEILKEAEDKHERLMDLEEQYGDAAFEKDEHAKLTFDLSYLMRDFLSAKYWEDRDKNKIYYAVPKVIDFYSGEVGTVELDPDIAEAVRIFNEKGYQTIASCAGHINAITSKKPSAGYIWMAKYPSEKLPKGLVKCKDRTGGNSIRWSPKTSKGLKTVHKVLLEYAHRVKSQSKPA